MLKIKDRIVLGIIAGLSGNLVKMGIDELWMRIKIPKRSFRETAAGAWVWNRGEARSLKGQAFGLILDSWMASLGGIGAVYMLSKTGKDQLLPKGLMFGISIGSFLTAALSALPANKVPPRGATSNLSNLVSHAAYGVVTTYIAAALGDPSLYDAGPVNDYDYSGRQEANTERIESMRHTRRNGAAPKTHNRHFGPH
ncbi:MAG: hypothetical protein AB1497_04515 [Bacillota bacterium]